MFDDNNAIPHLSSCWRALLPVYLFLTQHGFAVNIGKHIQSFKVYIVVCVCVYILNDNDDMANLAWYLNWI